MATTPEERKDVDVTREHVTWGRWKEKRGSHGCFATFFAPYHELADGAQRLAPPASAWASPPPCYRVPATAMPETAFVSNGAPEGHLRFLLLVHSASLGDSIYYSPADAHTVHKTVFEKCI